MCGVSSPFIVQLKTRVLVILCCLSSTHNTGYMSEKEPVCCLYKIVSMWFTLTACKSLNNLTEQILTLHEEARSCML